MVKGRMPEPIGSQSIGRGFEGFLRRRTVRSFEDCSARGDRMSTRARTPAWRPEGESPILHVENRRPAAHRGCSRLPTSTLTLSSDSSGRKSWNARNRATLSAVENGSAQASMRAWIQMLFGLKTFSLRHETTSLAGHSKTLSFRPEPGPASRSRKLTLLTIHWWDSRHERVG
jgi:hypothetical protein